MSTPVFPQPFQSGFRTIDGTALNSAIDADITSSQDGITAGAGGGLSNAVQLTANMSRVTIVANANDSVKLPAALAGSTVYLDNDGANTLAVYPQGTDTLEDSTSAITMIAGQDSNFVCPVQGKWYQTGTSGSFSGTFTGTLVDPINNDTKIVAANSAFSSNITLANLSGVAIPLTAGGAYAFIGEFPMSSGASGGVQFALNSTNSLALTNLNMTAKLYPANGSPLILNTTTSALGTALGSTAAFTMAELTGAFTVNTAGTLTVQAAQNASNGTSTTIFQNGFMQVTRSI